MKTTIYILTALFLVSCSMEKRRYSRGFHITNAMGYHSDNNLWVVDDLDEPKGGSQRTDNLEQEYNGLNSKNGDNFPDGNNILTANELIGGIEKNEEIYSNRKLNSQNGDSLRLVANNQTKEEVFKKFKRYKIARTICFPLSTVA